MSAITHIQALEGAIFAPQEDWFGQLLERGLGLAPTAANLAAFVPAAKRQLLVVEDSLTSRTLLRNIMISAGYEVETAVDGVDAWTKVQQRRFDCILSDIEMPNMNGWDFCARVKRETALADIPFVLITSLSKDEERRRGLELGADAYMVKGVFNEQELLDTLERLVA